MLKISPWGKATMLTLATTIGVYTTSLGKNFNDAEETITEKTQRIRENNGDIVQNFIINDNDSIKNAERQAKREKRQKVFTHYNFSPREYLRKTTTISEDKTRTMIRYKPGFQNKILQAFIRHTENLGYSYGAKNYDNRDLAYFFEKEGANLMLHTPKQIHIYPSIQDGIQSALDTFGISLKDMGRFENISRSLPEILKEKQSNSNYIISELIPYLEERYNNNKETIQKRFSAYTPIEKKTLRNKDIIESIVVGNSSFSSMKDRLQALVFVEVSHDLFELATTTPTAEGFLSVETILKAKEEVFKTDFEEKMGTTIETFTEEINIDEIPIPGSLIPTEYQNTTRKVINISEVYTDSIEVSGYGTKVEHNYRFVTTKIIPRKGTKTGTPFHINIMVAVDESGTIKKGSDNKPLVGIPTSTDTYMFAYMHEGRLAILKYNPTTLKYQGYIRGADEKELEGIKDQAGKIQELYEKHGTKIIP